MRKLWINDNQFMEIPEDRGALTREIASRSRSIDWFGIYAFLPDPDPVLQKLGEDITVYRQLLADAHVGSCWINRKSATLSKEWEIREPAGNLKRINRQVMDLIDQVMKQIDVYQIITDCLEAPFFGMSPLEVLWESGAKWLPKAVVGRPPEWFQFNEQNELRFKSRENMIQGEAIPDNKFLLVRHHASYLNPYGDRVLSRCFWPVVFKKGGFKYWAVFTEKYGMPWLVGKVPRKTNETERTALLGRLVSMVQDACAVINDDESIDISEAEGKTASADIFAKLIDAANKECSKAILGHTASVDATPGKLGSEDTQIEVREDLAGEDQRMVAAVFTKLFKWITALNFGEDTAAPEFGWFEEEDVQTDRAERDGLLTKQGLQFTKIYYQRRYNLEEDEFEIGTPAPEIPPGTPPGTPMGGQFGQFGQFAEADPAGQTAVIAQRRVDGLIDRAVSEALPVFEDYIAVISKWLASADSLDQAARNIFMLYDALNSEALAGQFAQGMMEADGIGAGSAGGQFAETQFAEAKWGFGTPFREAVDYFRARSLVISGIAMADMLAEIKVEIIREMEAGYSLDAFRRALGDIMNRHGYDALHPFRIETIFRTNLQGAFQAGRYRQLTDPAVLSVRPYWRYVAVMDGATRPTHAAMHGKVFPADHPFWNIWYPPNGWNCRCTVTSHSDREIAKNNWKIESVDPTGRLIEPIDPLTGVRMPARLLMPDPGWGVNQAAQSWTPSLDDYEPALRRKLEARIGPVLEKLNAR